MPFASLVQLSQGRDAIGTVLVQLPKEVLTAADRWAEQNYEAAFRRRDPLLLPGPDPWQFLIDAPFVHEEEKQILRAAQSQIFAVRKLKHMAMGMSTLKTDWYEEAAKARAKGDERRYKHAVGKMADALLLFDEVQADVREQGYPELLKEMNRMWSKRRAQLVHRGRKSDSKAMPLPQWNVVRERFRLPAILTELWVRSKLWPGFLFWRLEALTELLKNLLKNQNLT